MAEKTKSKTKRKPFKVEIWEYERGWGQRPFHTEYFDDIEKADKYVEDYNKENNREVVPDIYWKANKPTINRG